MTPTERDREAAREAAVSAWLHGGESCDLGRVRCAQCRQVPYLIDELLKPMLSAARAEGAEAMGERCAKEVESTKTTAFFCGGAPSVEDVNGALDDALTLAANAIRALAPAAQEPSPPACGTCGGRGRISKVYDCGSADCDKPSGWQPCPACQPCGDCNGTGKLSGGMGRGPVNCPACQPCGTCRGSGRHGSITGIGEDEVHEMVDCEACHGTGRAEEGTL